MLRRVAHQYLALLLMAVCTLFVFCAWAAYELIAQLAQTTLRSEIGKISLDRVSNLLH